jgi:hypothetical protein
MTTVPVVLRTPNGSMPEPPGPERRHFHDVDRRWVGWAGSIQNDAGDVSGWHHHPRRWPNPNVSGPTSSWLVRAGSPRLLHVGEPDQLGVERAHQQLIFGGRLVELAEPHRRVARDDDGTFAGLDDDHL